MAGVARYADRFLSQDDFYAQARDGTLPQFSWINPPEHASDHPCFDNAQGERLLKDIYEALRSGKAWEKTLFVVVYDDAGGYYDPVVPPFEGVPADDAPCHLVGRPGFPPSCKNTSHHCPPGTPPFYPATICSPFDFRRLGLRSAAMLISPYVPKGVVFQQPKRGPTPTSQFELTSIASTVKNLFNLSTFLTKRDAWAGNFEELLLDAPRTDAPLHLPTAPRNMTPWDVPPRGATKKRQLRFEGATVARHCSSEDGSGHEACRGLDRPSLKQEKAIALLSTQLSDGDGGDGGGSGEENLDRQGAQEKVAALWGAWLAAGAPVKTDDASRHASAAAAALALPTADQLGYQALEVGAMFTYNLGLYGSKTGNYACAHTALPVAAFAPNGTIDTDAWLEGVAALGGTYALLTAQVGV